LVAWLYARGFPVNREVNRLLGEDASRAIEAPTFAARLTRLAIPMLVVHGALDPRSVKFATRLAALVPGAELLVLPKVGRVPPFEDPASFASAVRDFLARRSTEAG
jgi:pimeloyl-ACP methyl ester carboxylesterase